MSERTRRVWHYLNQPWRLAVPFKRLVILLGSLVVAALVYYYAIANLRTDRYLILSITVLWLMTAYFLLPRIHRLLSKVYVPNYFIGRARTSDGLLADPVNLAVNGDRKALIKAMENAGWTGADPITPKNALRTILATIRRRSYPTAPVSDLFVFGHKQSIVFQKEVDGNPAKRHHVRFWRVYKNAYLPGGYKVNWVGAATYDDAVGFSLFTLQITHTIDGDVDAERDFVVATLKEARATNSVRRIDGFFPGYTHHNGGGNKFFTDGSMVIVDLKEGTLK